MTDLAALAARGRVLPILQHPDPVLRRVCRGLPDDPVQMAADLLATMYAAPGRGLAAPQVGFSLRMFVIDTGWKDGAADPLVALDPEILDLSAEQATAMEGCLSIPGPSVAVTRPAAVTLRWTGLDGIRRERRLSGIEAVCAQHEADHLDGRLIVDFGAS